MVIGVALPSAFWFVRDWVEVGNPLFPEPVRIFGHQLFAGPTSPLTRYSTSLLQHLLRVDTGPLSTWSHDVGQLVGPVLVLAACGVIVGAVVGIKRRQWELLALSLTAAAAWLAYAVTPYTGGGPDGVTYLITSQLRYALPALFLSAMVAAIALPWIVTTALAAVALALRRSQDHRGTWLPSRPSPNPLDVGTGRRGCAHERPDSAPVVGTSCLRSSPVESSERVGPVRRPSPSSYRGGVVRVGSRCTGCRRLHLGAPRPRRLYRGHPSFGSVRRSPRKRRTRRGRRRSRPYGYWLPGPGGLDRRRRRPQYADWFHAVVGGASEGTTRGGDSRRSRSCSLRCRAGQQTERLDTSRMGAGDI